MMPLIPPEYVSVVDQFHRWYSFLVSFMLRIQHDKQSSSHYIILIRDALKNMSIKDVQLNTNCIKLYCSHTYDI